MAPTDNFFAKEDSEVYPKKWIFVGSDDKKMQFSIRVIHRREERS
jgi:hypothetical protein